MKTQALINEAFFSEKVSFRLRREDIKKVKNIVKNNSLNYFNESHFFRVAALRLIRAHENKEIKKVLLEED